MNNIKESIRQRRSVRTYDGQEFCQKEMDSLRYKAETALLHMKKSEIR